MPRPRTNRPRDNSFSVTAVMAVMAGVRAGIWSIAEPTLIVSVRAATHDRTVTASEPHASAAHTMSYPIRSATLTDSTSSAGRAPM